MARCIDWPCCGHEAGCCPDFDDAGRQLNMVCLCGMKLPVNNRSSICNGCLVDMHDQTDGYGGDEPYDYDNDDVDELQENQDFAHDDDFYNRVEDMGDFWGDE